jgi:hypothetical protein
MKKTSSVKSYLGSIMEDVDGVPSSKRYVALICLIVVIIGFMANLFWGYKVDQFVFDGIRDIGVTGLGFTGLEKFSKKSPSEPDSDESPIGPS